jgi:hypothetical protein
MSEGAQPGAGQGPHPLATALARSLASERPGVRVLVLGAGNGRSLPVLIDAGLEVDAVEADADVSALAGPYGGVLSTHALLHGTQLSVRERAHALATITIQHGLLHATFGSTSDPRFGVGIAVAGGGWASRDGPEAGIAHAYFDRRGLLEILSGFEVVSADERDVRQMVGRWAHDADPNFPSVHWFVVARRP